MASIDLEAARIRTSTLHFTPHSSTSSGLNKARPLLRCMIWALILLVIAISACTFAVWYVLRPRVPIIHINSFDISNSTQYKMGFTVKNRNLLTSLWFCTLNMSLFYNGHKISSSSLETFSLNKMNETTQSVEFAVASPNNWLQIEETNAIDDMGMEVTRKRLSFDVEVRDSVVISAGKLYYNKKKMEILCQDLKMEYFFKERSWKFMGEKNCLVRFSNAS
nr:uncharacterized protein LOC113741794 [Coffea arabica]